MCFVVHYAHVSRGVMLLCCIMLTRTEAWHVWCATPCSHASRHGICDVLHQAQYARRHGMCAVPRHANLHRHIACVACQPMQHASRHQCNVLRPGGLSAPAVPALSIFIYIPATSPPPFAAKRPPACGSAIEMYKVTTSTGLNCWSILGD